MSKDDQEIDPYDYSDEVHEIEDFMKFPYGRAARDQMSVHFEDQPEKTNSPTQEDENK